MATPGRGIVSVDCAGEVVQAIWTKPKEPEERQVLEAGDNGMATCTWSDGSTYYSNVPNLVLKSREESKVKVREGYPNAKRPAAACGKKAKAKAKKKAKKKAASAADPPVAKRPAAADAAADPPPKKKQDRY